MALKKVGAASGNSGITKALEKELEHLTKTGSPMKYGIIRGDDAADLRIAYQNILDGTLSKSDAIKIAIEKRLVEDDDNITAKKAIEAIKKAVSKPEKETKKAVKVKSDDLDLSKKEDRLKLNERKKAQYSNDAYTGNGTQKPSQLSDQSNTDNPRERYLVPDKQKNVQMKSDITPGEQMDPVAPVASTDADKEIEALQIKLEAAKKRKVDEDMQKLENLKSVLNSLSPELRATLRGVLGDDVEKKSELKVEALDAPALPDEIVKTEVGPLKQHPQEIEVNIGTGRGTSSNPTMSQDLLNPNTSNPTMGQDIAASKKKAQVESSSEHIVPNFLWLAANEGNRGNLTDEQIISQAKDFLDDRAIYQNADEVVDIFMSTHPDLNAVISEFDAKMKAEHQASKKHTPIMNVMANKECLDEIVKLLSSAKEIEELLKARTMLQDGIIPVENIDAAIAIWTTDKEKAKTHIDEQTKLIKNSLKLKAKFIKDADKKTDSYWLVKSTKNEPIFKITASQAFGTEIVANWDMFKSEEYGKTLENELKRKGVLNTIEKYYPDATIFDEGLKNIMNSRAKVVAQVTKEQDEMLAEKVNDIAEAVENAKDENKQESGQGILQNVGPLANVGESIEISEGAEMAPLLLAKRKAQIPQQTDMAVGEPNTEPMDLKEDGANVVDHSEEIQKDLGAPALVSKEISDELLAPTEKQPPISDLLVEILSPMILGSEVNTPESIIQDLKSLLTDDDSSNIFLGKIKQKVYELGNATKNDVTAPEAQPTPEQKPDDAKPEEMLKMQSKIVEMTKREAELKQANTELKEVVKKTGIERSAQLRAGRAKRLANLRLEIELESKDTTNDLMKLSTKDFLEKEAETAKIATRLKSGKNNAFVKEAGKLWGKGAFGLSHLSEDNKEPSLIKGSKLEVSWSRAVKDKKEEEN